LQVQSSFANAAAGENARRVICVTPLLSLFPIVLEK